MRPKLAADRRAASGSDVDVRPSFLESVDCDFWDLAAPEGAIRQAWQDGSVREALDRGAEDEVIALEFDQELQFAERNTAALAEIGLATS